MPAGPKSIMEKTLPVSCGCGAVAPQGRKSARVMSYPAITGEVRNTLIDVVLDTIIGYIHFMGKIIYMVIHPICISVMNNKAVTSC